MSNRILNVKHSNAMTAANVYTNRLLSSDEGTTSNVVVDDITVSGYIGHPDDPNLPYVVIGSNITIGPYAINDFDSSQAIGHSAVVDAPNSFALGYASSTGGVPGCICFNAVNNSGAPLCFGNSFYQGMFPVILSLGNTVPPLETTSNANIGKVYINGVRYKIPGYV